MHFNEFSHRHGKELLKVLHPDIVSDVKETLSALAPFPHGSKKSSTVTQYLTDAFHARGWVKEARASFSTAKANYIDLCKWKVAIELEFSKFETFFRDFFRFMLLYERQEIDVGIIITFDDMAFERWQRRVKSYQVSRATLQKLTDILTGNYGPIVRVPLWCIGIE